MTRVVVRLAALGAVLWLAGGGGWTMLGEEVGPPGAGARPLIVPAAGRRLVGWSVSLAALPEGGLAAAWLERSPDGGDTAVRTRRFDGGLNPLEGPVTVASSTGCQGRVEIAPLPDRGAIVVWCAASAERTWVLRGRLLHAGEPVGAAFELADTAHDLFAKTPVAACGERVLVAWADAGQAGRLRAALLDRTGQRVGEVVDLGPTAGGREAEPAIACGAGRFLVAWSSGEALWTRAVGLDALPAGPRLRVDSGGPAGWKGLPAVAIETSGAAVFAWLERDDSGGLVVAARRFASDGRPVGPELQVSRETRPVPGTGRGPRLALGGGGGGELLMAWQGSERGVSQAASFGRWFDGRRHLPLEVEFPLTVGESASPEIATLANGSFVLAWADPQELLSAGAWARLVARPAPPGAPQTPAEVLCSGQRLAAALVGLRVEGQPAEMSLAPTASGAIWRAAYPALAGNGGPAAPAAARAAPSLIEDRAGGSAGAGAGTPACASAAVDREDEERAGWLAEHLRPVGDAPVTGMTFFRGEGVDTFRADLYLAAAADPAHPDQARAQRVATAARLALEVRLYCGPGGEPAQLRLRALPACGGASSGSGPADGCSDLSRSYDLAWVQDETSAAPRRGSRLWRPALGELWMALGGNEPAAPGGLCPSRVVKHLLHALRSGGVAAGARCETESCRSPSPPDLRRSRGE